MPRETHAPGPKTRATPLQRYISTLLTCKVTLGSSTVARFRRVVEGMEAGLLDVDLRSASIMASSLII